MRRITRSASVFRRIGEGAEAESERNQIIARNVEIEEFAAIADVHLSPPAVNRVKKSKGTKVKVSQKDSVTRTRTRTHDTVDFLTILTPSTLVLTGGNQAAGTTTTETSPGPCDAIRTRDVDGDEGERDIKKDIISYSYSSLAAPTGRPANSDGDGGGSQNESTPTPTPRKKSLRSYSVAPTCGGLGQQQGVADSFYQLDLLTETGSSPRTSISNLTDAVNSGEDGFSEPTSKPKPTSTAGTTGVPRQRHCASTNKPKLPKSSPLPTDSDQQESIRTVEPNVIDLTKADPGTSDAAGPRAHKTKPRLPKNSALSSDSDQKGIEIVGTVEVDCINLGKIGSSTSDVAEDGDATRTDIKGVTSPSVSSIQKLRSPRAPGRLRRNEATKKTSLTSSNLPQNISNYTLICSAEEDHRKQIYAVAFNWFLKPDQPLIFATVGSNRISIYECVKAATPLLDPKSKPGLSQQGSKDDSPLKLLQVYEDFDDDEVFYTCAWMLGDYVGSYLAAAGLRGVIRIFSPAVGECVKDFVGHTGAVNSLSVHPLDFNLLLSSSQDHSIRLWNIKTNVCVAIFSGENGHRDEVIDAGFNLSGSRFVSGGLDHSVKVWLLDRDDIKSNIQYSYTWHAQIVERCSVKGFKHFPTFIQHFPDFSSRDIHHDYVDCVKWFGEFVISKSSVANKIVCWKGGDMFQKWADVVDHKINKHTVVHEWKVDKCESWYLRFGFDGALEKLALGNEIGETYVFKMMGGENQEDGPSKMKPEVLRHPACNSVIRQTAWSRDGKVLICVCDDSTVWRWDYNSEK